MGDVFEHEIENKQREKEKLRLDLVLTDHCQLFKYLKKNNEIVQPANSTINFHILKFNTTVIFFFEIDAYFSHIFNY